MRKGSVKNERINMEVQKELSSILRSLKDPRIPLMISVMKTEVAPDLKTCKAYISILGDAEAQSSCKAALKSAAGYIRRELAHNLNLRMTPEITYILDQSIEYGVSMSARIDEVMAEQNEAAAIRDEAEREAAEEAEREKASAADAQKDV